MALLLGGCAGAARVDVPASAPLGVSDADIHGLLREALFTADQALFDNWVLMPIRGRGHWHMATDDAGVVIRGEAEDSASGAVLAIDLDPELCPYLEWQWMAEALQHTSDISDKATDDVAAGLFVLFGDPGSGLLPRPVPTLRYVWVAHHEVGEIIANPYLPGSVRNVVVHSGDADIGRWITQRRNLAADFEAAFGHAPDGPVRALALFVDNDQTHERAAVRFRDAAAYCTDGF